MKYTKSRKNNHTDTILKIIAHSLLVILLIAPEIAQAQTATTGAFGGITTALKSIAQAVIFDWGYYIGIISLGVQGYRWKMGRIDSMHLLYWGLGISMVFFAPNIVGYLKSNSAGSIQ